MKRRGAGDRGAVAILTAALVPVLIFLVAMAVDVGRWYVEASRVQKAADAASLGGVTYMPTEFDKAKTTAQSIAQANGYAASAVSVFPGQRTSQLGVTVSGTVNNLFGKVMANLLNKPELATTTIARTAVSDYQRPALLASPCNALGNQPEQDPTFANPSALCASPNMWAMIEGPAEDKTNGDRYMTVNCQPADASFCTGGKNSEYDESGYFYVIRVGDAAVNTPINLELYDPAYVDTGNQCAQLPPAYSGAAAPPTANTTANNNSWTQTIFNGMNPYVPTSGSIDAKTRYDDAVNAFCAGDTSQVGYSGSAHDATKPPNTSFALFQPTATQDPKRATIQQSTSSQPCVAQFRGFGTQSGTAGRNFSTTSNTSLRQGNRDGTSNNQYNDGMAKVFHRWVSLCTFTPAEAGDYYVQVRTNIALPSSGGESNSNGLPSVTYRNNTVLTDPKATPTELTSSNINAFSIRAYPANVADAAVKTSITVAGYEHMAVWSNTTSSTVSFPLLQVTSESAGKSFDFSFFDGGSCTGSCSGYVRVLYPTVGASLGGTAITTSLQPQNCSADGVQTSMSGGPTSSTSCQVAVSSSANDKKVQAIHVPIPTNYLCEATSTDACWYKVEFALTGNMTDTTTWDAGINGDPVRLVQ